MGGERRGRTDNLDGSNKARGEAPPTSCLERRSRGGRALPAHLLGGAKRLPTDGVGVEAVSGAKCRKPGPVTPEGGCRTRGGSTGPGPVGHANPEGLRDGRGAAEGQFA